MRPVSKGGWWLRLRNLLPLPLRLPADCGYRAVLSLRDSVTQLFFLPIVNLLLICPPIPSLAVARGLLRVRARLETIVVCLRSSEQADGWFMRLLNGVWLRAAPITSCILLIEGRAYVGNLDDMHRLGFPTPSCSPHNSHTACEIGALCQYRANLPLSRTYQMHITSPIHYILRFIAIVIC